MILLDTHTLVWSVAASPRLGQHARIEIEAAWDDYAVSVSSFSFWELGNLKAKGKLDFIRPVRSLRNTLLANGLRVIPVDDEIAIRSTELGAEGFHPDPADRIITATAIVGGYRLATSDRKITDWADRTGLVAILNPEA